MKTAFATLLASTFGVAAAFADTPSTQPAAQAMPAPAQPTGTFESYQATAKETMKAYQAIVPNEAFLADANASQRDAAAAQAVPMMKSVLANLDQMADVRPDIKRQIKAVRLNKEAELYAFGDASTIAALEEAAKGTGVNAEAATNVILRGQWYRAGRDPKLQADVIAALDKAAAAQPGDVFLSQFIADIRPSTVNPADRQHLMELMKNTMDNPTSKALVRVMENADLTLSFEGKPMVLEGKLADGKSFTSADWKGKVVLVDFWAVWCAPCRAELPRVKKVYDQYHDKGFEVLGVSNDEEAETVIKFTAHEQLPWPQLFDAESAAKGGWHPLTKTFGINGIPVMFLIDKKGVCRTVSAREDFEKLIPQMLAE